MKIAPDSINLKMSDRNVPDGSLQESVNVQWRDGANRPIPYRNESDIDVRLRDYYVPSFNQLTDVFLYMNSAAESYGAFVCWSSTEVSDLSARSVNRSSIGFIGNTPAIKEYTRQMLPIRQRAELSGDAVGVLIGDDRIYDISGGVTYMFNESLLLDNVPWSGDIANVTVTGATSTTDGGANTELVLSFGDETGGIYDVANIQTGYFVNIITHKIGDENIINILGFDETSNELYQIGQLVDGVYTENVLLLSSDIINSDDMSYAVLNGILYFMSPDNEYYYSLQYNQTDDVYVIKDVYSWKGIYPTFDNLAQAGTMPIGYSLYRCGSILMRYSFVLSTGEEVLHSPMYPYYLNAFVPGAVAAGDLLENIHTYVDLSLGYSASELSTLESVITGVNVYMTTAKYKTDYLTTTRIDDDEYEEDIKAQMDDVFYLVGQYDFSAVSGGGVQVVFTVGDFTLNYLPSTGKIDVATIAAGSVMPVDNFTHHKLFGELSTANGRIIINSPKTVMTSGYIKSISFDNATPYPVIVSNNFTADTEDGIVSGEYEVYSTNDTSYSYTVGVVSYPDSRATIVHINLADSVFLNSSLRRLQGSNIAVDKGLSVEQSTGIVFSPYNIISRPGQSLYIRTEGTGEYNSENRLQFSAAGEYSVFPAINSYRVGEGKIVFVGSNRVNPENVDVVAPLIIGTTDGVYTLNLDITGENLVNSITKTKNLPALSAETLEIEGNLLFVSDKGLIVINNGTVVNLTNKVFPDQGDGSFPTPEATYPNYFECISKEGEIEPYIKPYLYKVDDIVTYLRGCIMAYDGRRNNVWCSNPNYNFSLVYSLELQKWSSSTIVFDQAIEFFSIINEGYSRFLVKGSESLGGLGQEDSKLLILSSENEDSNVSYHLLTRPIKMGHPDVFKKIDRFISRCQLHTADGDEIFSLGLWGKQDVNKDANGISLIAISDSDTYNNDVRQDIPVGSQKGKYKLLTVLQSGIAKQNSSIDYYDIAARLVDTSKMR